jgi:aspartate beta-hydroxylase
MSDEQLGAVLLRTGYDTERLQRELAQLAHERFRGQRTYGESLEPSEETELDWKVLSLRSPGGDNDRTDPGGAGLVEYADTLAAQEAPYMASIFRSLPTRVRAARLMSLGAGAEVGTHRDYPYGLAAGWVRLHVPVVTNPGAVLVIDGEEMRWQPGELWYGDFSRPHSVRNTGDSRRVHLLIDCFVNEALLGLFPSAFISRIRWSEVLLDRPDLPLSTAELAGFECQFALPKAFLWGEEEDLGRDGIPECPARLRVVDGDLILHADDRPVGRLHHIGLGEFRFSGWNAERTIALDLRQDTGQVRFRVRFGSRIYDTARPVTRVGIPSHA